MTSPAPKKGRTSCVAPPTWWLLAAVAKVTDGVGCATTVGPDSMPVGDVLRTLTGECVTSDTLSELARLAIGFRLECSVGSAAAVAEDEEAVVETEEEAAAAVETEEEAV